MWQPLQVDHKDTKGREDGSYSDMQKAEKMMAEAKGIRVLEFPFKEAEVSKINTKDDVVRDDESDVVRDETAFKQRLTEFLLEHGIADDMSPPPPPPIPGGTPPPPPPLGGPSVAYGGPPMAPSYPKKEAKKPGVQMKT